MSEFDAYRGLFVAESRENHENVVMNLLLLKKGSNRGAVDETFRSIHMLKGAAASMGFSHLEHLCHAIEDVFSCLRSGAASISPELGNLLAAGSDLIGQMLDDIETGGDASTKNPDELVNALGQWIDQSDTRQTSRTESFASMSVSWHPVLSSPIPDDTENLQKYRIRITVAGKSSLRGMRAMLALTKLKALGTIISVFPPEEVLVEGTFDGTLHLVIASDAQESVLTAAASGFEIQNVEILTVEKREILAPYEMQDVTSLPPVPGEGRKLADMSPARGFPEGELRAVENKETLVPEDGAGTMRSGGDDTHLSPAADKTWDMNHLLVDIHQLDHIMALIENLSINTQSFRQIAAAYTIKEMDEAMVAIDRSVSELRNQVMNIRSVPVNCIFHRFRTVAENVARTDGKEVEFVLDGGDTEIEWSVMDGLIDPLLHLIRNAVHHGIESPEARKQAGKTQQGRIVLSVQHERDNLVIELTDDGAGINIGRVRETAIERGLITSKAADTVTTERVIEMIFQPGFSYSGKIPEKSIREPGLYAVRESIGALNGTISVETTPGKGSRFKLLLPPPMAVLDVMVISINNKRFGIPTGSIIEVTDFRRDAIHHIGKGEVILLHDEVLQVLRLDEITGTAQECGSLLVVLYQERKCCIPVDRVEGRQEVVVKPLSTFIGVARGVKGVTILGDGGIIPVLDINNLV